MLNIKHCTNYDVNMQNTFPKLNEQAQLTTTKPSISVRPKACQDATLLIFYDNGTCLTICC